jgi:hypothetical protein
MRSPTPPAPPDPVATARAQSQTNRDTATTQQQLNMVDQTNPYGSQTYQQTGKWQDGTPRYSQTTTLSPQEQNKQNQQWQFDSLVNQLGIDQTGRLSGLLSKPVQLGNEATESRLMELGRKRLDPILSQRRDGLESKLYNQGLQPGTEAWTRAMGELGQQENDAYNQLLLSGRGQANQEMLTERNQPINEITALMSGGQVSQPNFGNTPQSQVAGTDLAGLTMDAYRYGPLAQYQAEQQNRGAMMSGLFGLGGAALGGWARGGFGGR